MGQEHTVDVVMAVECKDAIILFTQRKARWLDVQDAEATLWQEGPSPEREASLKKAQEALADVDMKLKIFKQRESSGTAFVTFELASEHDRCIAHFAVPEWVRALELLGLKWLLKNSTWATKFERRRQMTTDFGVVDKHGYLIDKGQLMVEVTAAPEPEDVLWENLGVSRARSIAYTAVSLVVVVLLLCVSTLIMLVLKWTINEIYLEIDTCLLRYEEAKLQGTDQADVECKYDYLLSWGSNWLTVVTMLLSCASSLSLIILNTLIRAAVYAMAEHECKHTRTLKEKTVFYKMSFAYTTNSVLLLMLVYYDEAADWGKPGLVLNQALLLLCSDLALTSIVSRLTNGMGYWPLYRWYGRRVAVSQARLQEYYRPPTLLLGELYASVVRTYALCMYYGPMQPLCYWLGACTMLANYLCSKYALVHYYRVPPRMSDELCEGLRQVLTILLVGHVVVTIYFYANSCEGGCRSQVWTPIVLAAVAYVLFVLVPVKWVSWLARHNVQDAEATCLKQCCREEAEDDMEAEPVVLTLTASGSVSDYSDTSSLQQAVATAAGVDKSLVTIRVAAASVDKSLVTNGVAGASVIITATIAMPASNTAATRIVNSLYSNLGTAAAAYAALGVTVETVPTISDLRYSDLKASLQARRVHGSHVDESGQVDGTAHVTYDVPVPELDSEAHLVTNQPRFLRYDFTPEILRTPYCFPLPPESETETETETETEKRTAQAADDHTTGRGAGRGAGRGGYAQGVHVTSTHLAIADGEYSI